MTTTADVPVWTPEVARRTADVFERMRRVVPELEWPVHAPYVAAIHEWKAKRNAVVLAHNYQTPEIFHGVADITGDSLALAQKAAETDADVIVLAGVHFMAETAKILSPEKTVLIPDREAGCSLAASITGADVRLLRQRYPGVPVVTYVNTSAEVKAESDICCTSANAVEVVESLGVPRVIFLPDEYLGRYVATQTKVEIILWQGHCEVHERFTGAEIARVPRRSTPGVERPRPPRVPARRARRGRLRRLDRRHGPARRRDAAGARGDGDRVLDERQRGRPVPRDRVRAALQPVPAHEAHHAAEDPARAADAASTGWRSSPRSPRAPGGRSSGCWPSGRGAGALKRAASTPSATPTSSWSAPASPGFRVALGSRAAACDLARARRRWAHGGSSPWAQGGIAGAVGAGDSPALHAADTLAVAGELADAAAVARLHARGPGAAPGAAGARRALRPRRRAAQLDLAARRRTARRASSTRGTPPAPRWCARWVRGRPRRRADRASSKERVALELARRTAAASRAWSRATPTARWCCTGRAPWCWRPAASASSTRTPPTRPRRAATAWRWPGAPARGWPTSSSCSSTRRRSTSAPTRCRSLTEALRGEGAVLVDERGRRFLPDAGPDAELRRATSWRARSGAALGAGRRPSSTRARPSASAFPERFPTVFEACRRHGLDPRREPIPVAPAAHYHMGGVLRGPRRPDELPGLWACGEVACTGVHGANRLASNSLLEGLVFGARVAALDAPTRSSHPRVLGEPDRRAQRRGLATRRGERPAAIESEVRGLMWERSASCERGRRAARRARSARGAGSRAADAGPSRNLLTVARLVATAALARTESRGAHYRADHPRHRSGLAPPDRAVAGRGPHPPRHAPVGERRPAPAKRSVEACA